MANERNLSNFGKVAAHFHFLAHFN